LVVTGDYAGIGHVWDMRTGKSVFQLHVRRKGGREGGEEGGGGGGLEGKRTWHLLRKI